MEDGRASDKESKQKKTHNKMTQFHSNQFSVGAKLMSRRTAKAPPKNKKKATHLSGISGHTAVPDVIQIIKAINDKLNAHIRATHTPEL